MPVSPKMGTTHFFAEDEGPISQTLLKRRRRARVKTGGKNGICVEESKGKTLFGTARNPRQKKNL